MTLRFNIFGYEIARVELDLADSEPREVDVIDKAAKGLSRWFFGRLSK